MLNARCAVLGLSVLLFAEIGCEGQSPTVAAPSDSPSPTLDLPTSTPTLPPNTPTPNTPTAVPDTPSNTPQTPTAFPDTPSATPTETAATDASATPTEATATPTQAPATPTETPTPTTGETTYGDALRLVERYEPGTDFADDFPLEPESPDGEDPPPDDGSIPVFFEFTEAVSMEGVAYLGGQGGLMALRVHDADTIEPLGVMTSGPRISALDADSGYLFTVAGNEINVFKTTPDGNIGEAILRLFPTGDATPGQLDFHHDHLYVPGPSHGLLVYDASPSALEFRRLTELAHLEEGLDSPTAVLGSGDFLYVADGTGGLKVVDISDTSAPFVVAGVELDGVAQQMEYTDGILYMSLGSAGIAIVDVSDPRLPFTVAHIDSKGTAFGLALVDDRLFVAGWSLLEVFDVSDVENPRFVALDYPESSALDVTLVGDAVLVADWYVVSILEYIDTFRAPELYLPGPSLQLAIGEGGETVTEALTLYNLGETPLEITRVEQTPRGTFDLSATALTIAPQGFETIEISYQVSSGPGASEATATLSFQSNDPDAGDLQYPVVYGGFGLQVGEEAPDFTLDTLDGSVLTLSDQIGSIVLLAYFTTW